MNTNAHSTHNFNMPHMSPVHSCVEILKHLEKKESNPTAFNCQINGKWESLSTEQFLESVKYLALGLRDIGLQPGDRVGLLAEGSPQWSIADFAIMLAGGIVVPLFSTISNDNFIYEVKQTDIKLIFVGGEEHRKLLQRHLPLFNVIVGIQDITIPISPHIQMHLWSSLIKRGKIIDKENPLKYEEMKKSVQPSTPALIIYTSGSTGDPKGVELTQENISCSLHNDPYSWDPFQDRYLNLLPLEHIFGHSINLWMILWGVSIYYSNDYKNLSTICQEVKPTLMVVVPRLIEKIYNKMFDQLEQSQGIRRLIGTLAFNLAKDEDKSWIKSILNPVLDPLVYSKLRNAFGGKVRVVISGGASLDPHLHFFFEQIGIPIYEGWGMTEACPICVNLDNKRKIGSVGPPLEGYELKITSEGEILVKGKGVMQGYYRNPEATAKALDAEGWLHTGDRGCIDSEGALTILGRMKELYKTSTGEYVAPVPIEQALCRHPLIESAMVIADGKKFTSSLLFPNHETLSRIKKEREAATLTDEQFLNSPKIKLEIETFINKINEHLNHWEQIRNYRFIMTPPTIEEGELTVSMKMKRNVIAQKYQYLINEMYQKEPL